MTEEQYWQMADEDRDWLDAPMGPYRFCRGRTWLCWECWKLRLKYLVWRVTE